MSRHGTVCDQLNRVEFDDISNLCSSDPPTSGGFSLFLHRSESCRGTVFWHDKFIFGFRFMMALYANWLPKNSGVELDRLSMTFIALFFCQSVEEKFTIPSNTFQCMWAHPVVSPTYCVMCSRHSYRTGTLYLCSAYTYGFFQMHAWKVCAHETPIK